MIKAVIFDFYGVLEEGGAANRRLLDFIKAELKPRYKLAIISNSSGSWQKRLLMPPDLALFDEVILSSQEGLEKPHPSIYELAAQKLGVAPAQCLFIDDTPGHCAGAQAVGMETIVYKDFEQMKAQLEALVTDSNN